MLYVFDPLALYNIVLKDVDTFVVPDWSLEYVPCISTQTVISNSLKPQFDDLWSQSCFCRRRVTSIVLSVRIFINSLFSGGEHRRQRKIMTPAFSAKSMRELMRIFYEVAHKVSLEGILYQKGVKMPIHL